MFVIVGLTITSSLQPLMVDIDITNINKLIILKLIILLINIYYKYCPSGRPTNSKKALKDDSVPD